MRSKRLIKFGRKNKKLFLVNQVLGIWYCVLLTLMHLSGSTGAAFNDIEVIENRIHAYWEKENTTAVWDKSSLNFQNDVGFQCASGFYSVIKNGGDKDMQGPTTFVLYFNGDKDPNKNNLGTEIGRGTVPGLKSGESFMLTYLQESIPSAGKYKFMAFQRPGHNGTGELWGNEITVNEKQLKVCQGSDSAKNEGVMVEDSITNIDNEVSDNFEHSPVEVTNSDGNSDESKELINNPKEVDSDGNGIHHKNDISNPIIDVTESKNTLN
jgi:YqxM protein